ncbi:MAG: thiamine pyrophosphate-binding protein [Streptosporangiaceae bacterium]
MLLHQAIARCLRAHGVEVIFGLIGDGNLYVVDSFCREQGRYISFANETGAVVAAGAYAQVSSGIGVATVTHGPGLTNTVTALVESVKARTPLLLIAGDTAVVDSHHLQNVDQRAIVVSTGAGFEQLRSPSTVTADVATAIRRALVERRPIVLNVPIDLQWFDVDWQPADVMRPIQPTMGPDAEALDSAVGFIASARRPVIVAGRGAANPASRASLLKLADRLGAPVATTLRAKDLFRGCRYNLDICGTLSHQVAAEVITASDCVLVFGARMHIFTTMNGGLVPPQKVLHISDDPSIVNQSVTSRFGIIGNPALVADTFVEMLDVLGTESSGYANDDLAARISEVTEAQDSDLLSAGSLEIKAALRLIDRAFPRDRMLVVDGGRVLSHAYKLLHVETPQGYVHSFNSGSIGLGLGTALGAAVAAPGYPVLLACGDGSFMIDGLAEFNTAVRHRLDIVVVVLNDGSYGAEYAMLKRRDMDPALSLFDWPDLGPVATALGGQGFTVRTQAELETALAVIERRDRPILIDIKLDPAKLTW